MRGATELRPNVGERCQPQYHVRRGKDGLDRVSLYTANDVTVLIVDGFQIRRMGKIS